MSDATTPISTTLTPGHFAADAGHESLMETLTADLKRLNDSVMNAVNAGISVELVRSARHHCGSGNWGDQITPVIVKG